MGTPGGRKKLIYGHRLKIANMLLAMKLFQSPDSVLKTFVVTLQTITSSCFCVEWKIRWWR